MTDAGCRLRTFRARTSPDAVDSLVEDRFPLVLGVIAVLSGLLVLIVAIELFPYHSINHDEGVYLQQAALLLDGTVAWTPPVPDAVRPWFFVDDGGRLYSKYSPVVPAMFAPGLAVGLPRVVLALVAAGNVALVGLLGREAFDHRVGLVAACLLVTAPMFTLTSATFLSYAPTTLLNLLFAFAYLRAVRRASTRYAVLAGLAVGLAFFSRPFTAVIFAAPFVGHALVVLARSLRGRNRVRETVTRLGTVGILGLGFVGLTLAYNWLQTGDPLVFPYQAFAPEDGIGFGHREILNHERIYTPELALEANSRVLIQLFTRWGPLGLLGSGLAALGVLTALVGPVWQQTRPPRLPRIDGPSDLGVRSLLLGTILTVSAGNVYFWGNLNVLAALEDPTDGLIAHLGPFYHFDVLAPLAIFAAAAVVTLGRRTRMHARRFDGTAATRIALAGAVLIAGLLGGVATASAYEEPVDRNVEYRDDLTSVYEPFTEQSYADGLVFAPTPYGDWLNHPFQWLRTDPSFESGPVFVLDRDAAGDFAALDAFPERQPYRFTYRGDWPPQGDGVQPVVEPLSVRSGDRVTVSTRTGVVVGAESATIRIAANGAAIQYGIRSLDGEQVVVNWTLSPDGAFVRGENVRRYGDETSVPLVGASTVSMSITYVQPGGSTVTYRQEIDVEAEGGTVRVLWPPESRVCRLTTDCGTAGTFVEGGDYPTGVSLSSNVTVDG